jgi:hypothetical protein
MSHVDIGALQLKAELALGSESASARATLEQLFAWIAWAEFQK